MSMRPPSMFGGGFIFLEGSFKLKVLLPRSFLCAIRPILSILLMGDISCQEALIKLSNSGKFQPAG